MAAALGPTLSQVLDGVWASSLPGAEKRRLCARAVTAPLLCGLGGGERGSAVERLEEVLAAVASEAGKDRVNVSTAKEFLRSKGDKGRLLASRLGRLSKCRNGSAHPDVSLLSDVQSLHTDEEVKGEDETEQERKERTASRMS